MDAEIPPAGEPPAPPTFGQRLEAARKTAGLSKPACARLLGISVSTFDNYRAGNTTPNETWQQSALRLVGSYQDKPEPVPDETQTQEPVDRPPPTENISFAQPPAELGTISPPTFAPPREDHPQAEPEPQPEPVVERKLVWRR